MAEICMIHDGALEVQEQVDRLTGLYMIDVPWKQRDLPPPRAKVGTYLHDDRARELMSLAIEREWEVASLPHTKGLQPARSAGAAHGAYYITGQETGSHGSTALQGDVADAGDWCNCGLDLRHACSSADAIRYAH